MSSNILPLLQLAAYKADSSRIGPEFESPDRCYEKIFDTLRIYPDKANFSDKLISAINSNDIFAIKTYITFLKYKNISFTIYPYLQQIMQKANQKKSFGRIIC